MGYYYKDHIQQRSLHELTALMDEGRVTSQELVWAYVERICEKDQSGPKLDAVRELNPDVFELAALRDHQRQQGVILGPLHGIPILLKDCIDTADRTHTTCGAVVMKDHYAKEDAFLVKRLREAGAIILGKANMSEWYGFISSKAPSGYNGISGGSMKNPYGPDRLKPGGSSGGCAVAVSADFAAAAIGTETAGSIIEPAYFCSVVGYKPTTGIVSRTGVLPIMMRQDTPGTLTRSVRDAAILANVLVAPDPEDAGTWRAEAFAGTDFCRDLDSAELKEKRIGVVWEGYSGEDPQERELTLHALERLREKGATVVEVSDFAPGKMKKAAHLYPGSLTTRVMWHVFRARFEEYLGKLGPDVPVHNLDELIIWNERHPDAIPVGQDYLYELQKICKPLMSSDFVEAHRYDIEICGRQGVLGALNRYSLNALVLPGVADQGIAPRIGCPIISIPAGYTQRSIPVGLNLIGRPMDDAALLQLAYACEQALEKRLPPQI